MGCGHSLHPLATSTGGAQALFTGQIQASSFCFYVKDNADDRSFQSAGERKGGRDRERSSGAGGKAAFVYRHQTQSRLHVPVTTHFHESAPKLRRATDGWGKRFQQIWVQKLEIWVCELSFRKYKSIYFWVHGSAGHPQLS